MSAHLTEPQLNELADGATADHDIASHLGECAECSAELESLRALLLALETLPDGITPERDLLAGIHTRIDESRVLPLSHKPRSRSFRRARYVLAAAAILLIAVSSVLTRALMQRAAGPAEASSSSVMLVRQQVRSLESDYVNAIDELSALIQAQRTELSPETIQLLERNLRVIDQAIRESRAALEQDPQNQMVTRMLWSAYEMKLDLLRRTTATAAT